MGVEDAPWEISHEHFVMRFLPQKDPQIPIDVGRIKNAPCSCSIGSNERDGEPFCRIVGDLSVVG